MTPELAKQYRPADVEPDILKRWNDARAFHAEPSDSGKPYCIVIPPPNVTAALHMGHALNNTLQDILIRWHRMLGDNTLWMPGTDHAGIATQTVVEKRVLAEEGKKRTDFQRDEFVKKIQAWKDEYEQTILGQLKAMGCSCDWDRTRFTMDDTCAAAVREAFFRLFKDGLIYRGKRLVNWDPATQTALADDEVEMEEIDGHFYYLRYPLIGPPLPNGQNYVTVATTRPETMLGDTAVAINPKDPRAAMLRGRRVLLPIVNREIPIIEDEYVVLPLEPSPLGSEGEGEDPKAKFATGFLKVTPAHDPNDYEIGLRHKLPVINVFAPDATISKDHGWPADEWDKAQNPTNDAEFLLGLDRFEARRAIVDWFRRFEMLEEVKPYRHSVGHSYRSHVPIEPYLSDQWYVKVTDDRLAGAALRAMAPEQREPSPTSRAHEEAIFSPTSRAFSPTSRAREEAVFSSPIPSPPPPLLDTALFLTFTCYGTWRHGDPRGSVDRDHNTPGTPILPEDAQREMQEFELLKHPPVALDAAARKVVEQAIREVCEHRGWKLLAINVRTKHVHVVVAADAPPERVMTDFKAYATRRLTEAGLFQKDARVWTRHGSTRYLNDQAAVTAACRYVLEEQGHDLGAQGGEVARPEAGGQPLPYGRGSSAWQGNLRFHPDRYAKTFEQWHLNIRDWCISRQLWWGHRIPVWSLQKGSFVPPPDQFDTFLNKLNLWETDGRVGRHYRQTVPGDYKDSLGRETRDIFVCVHNANDEEIIRELERWGYEQDPDVLDTWFSSALWPISTMGWPGETAELKTWNPSNLLCTAREIITLWVSRMTMFNIYFRGCLPFTDVYIHAMIQDGQGRKMSKSLGNGVDPLDIIHSHGSDAMRYTLAVMTTNTQDVRMPVVKDEATGRNTSEKFDLGRNFANKLWNAVRFALSNLEPSPSGRGQDEGTSCQQGRDDASDPSNLNAPSPQPSPKGRGGQSEISLADKWILSRLATAVRDSDAALSNYEFSAYAQGLYDFIWRDLCDWYIEAVKPTVQENPVQRRVLALCIDASLRLLHPVMPFVTEKLWEKLNEVTAIREVSGVELTPSALLINAAWPRVAQELIDPHAEGEFALLQEIVTAIRQVRTAYRVPPKQKVEVSAKAPAALAQKLLPHRALVETLTNMVGEEIGPRVEKPADAAAIVAGGVEIYLHGLIQADAEKARLCKRLDELNKNVAALSNRLASKSYTDKAPAHLVQQTRDQLAAAEREKHAVEEQLNHL